MKGASVVRIGFMILAYVIPFQLEAPLIIHHQPLALSLSKGAVWFDITNDLPSVFCWVSQMASSYIRL